MKVKPIPDDMHRVTPHLICAGAANAIEFYKKAFGAVEEARLPGQDGRLMHAVIRIHGDAVMLVDAGAKLTLPVQDMFWGDRYGKLEDPFGHHWSVATHQRDVSLEEARKAMHA